MRKTILTKKVLLINAELPIGGIGKYTTTLASIINEETSLFCVITHHTGQRYSNLANSCLKVYNLERFNKYCRYLVLLKIIWKLKPFCIINNNNAIFQYILPYIPRSKRICIIHGDSSQFYRLCSINAKYISKWITPSPRVEKNFNVYTHHLYSNRIKVIPHGTKISSPLCLNKSEERLTITFIGMLYEHKGVFLLPKIIQNVIEKCSSAIFNIIGDGDLKGWLENEIIKNQLTENIRLFGNVNDETVDRELSKSHIFLLPTRSESFGLSIIEAMAHGVIPVVSLINGTTNYIIDNNKSGFLVNPDDPNGFTTYILKLANDDSLRRLMSKNAYIKANDQFSLNTMQNAYLSEILK